ncbi:MAG TPA: cyclase family protein [Ktedonobacteraceae bacterium]
MQEHASLQTVIKKVNNWGRWGSEDELGTLNYITPEKRTHATQTVQRGVTFSLSLPFDRFGLQPPNDRRLNPQHIMLTSGSDLLAGTQGGQKGGFGYADDMIIMALQASTHWNALAHMFHDYYMYNHRHCSLVNAEGAQKNSIVVAATPLVSRSVLLDFPRALGIPALPEDHAITVQEIEQTLMYQNVSVESGDILLFRTGHMARFLESGSWNEYIYTNAPGPSFDVLPWLHEHQVAAVASDTWAFEAIPSKTPLWLPIHAIGMVYMGLLIGENFLLDDLARDCADDKKYEALICAAPIPFSRAVGAPVNPIVVK